MGDSNRIDQSTSSENPLSHTRDDLTTVNQRNDLVDELDHTSLVNDTITRLMNTSVNNFSIQNVEDLDLVVGQNQDPKVINWISRIVAVRMVDTIGYDAAFKQTQSYSDSISLRAMFAVVEKWASDDPVTALEVASTVEDTDIRLRLQKSVVTIWVQEDPLVFLENPPDVPPPLRGFATQFALETLALSNPKETATYLELYKGSTIESSLVELIANQWAELNAMEALRWASAEDVFSNDEIALVAISLILRVMAESNPEVAFDHALRISKQQGWPLLPRTVMWIIAESDIELARVMLLKMNSMITKREAAIPIGISLINRQQFDEALKLASDVDANLKYFEWIFDHWAMTRPFSLLNRLDQLPHKNRAALSLSYAHYTLRCFNTEQLHSLLQSLPSEEIIEFTKTFDDIPDVAVHLYDEFRSLRVQDTWGALHRHYLNSIPQMLSETGQLPKTIQRQ